VSTELVHLLEAGGVEVEDMDDLVHDLASQIATAVNNGGLSSQVDFVLEQLGVAEGRSELMTIVKAKKDK